MLKTTRWRPDTCKCVIEYSWNTDDPQETRTHSLSRIVSKCSAHQFLTDGEVYVAVTDENPRKNKVLGKIKELLPAYIPTTVGPDGNPLDDYSKIVWSFDAQRVLDITIAGIKNPERNSLQGVADTMFGTGKVRIQ